MALDADPLMVASPLTAFDRGRTVLSPLRYPGGKRWLVPYIAACLIENGLRPTLFVEPYAGGASVSLELSHLGFVERIASQMQILS
jgi:DNA adenine methylase